MSTRNASLSSAALLPKLPASAFALVLAVFALPLATDLVGQGVREYITPRTPSDPAAAPFSAAVLAGNTLYISGTLGLNAGRQLPATVEEEARNALNSVRGTLEAAGMSMDDLVFVQVSCSDVAHYDAFNAVYRTYFTKEYPARAFLGSGPLLFGARFEVLGIAVKR